jgi:superfamily II DNA or RNA helicase
MSIPIRRDSIKGDQASYISKYIQMVPEVKFIPGKRQFKEPEATPLYHRDGDIVHIPYTFAKGYFGAEAPIRPNITFDFLFNLREEQIPKAEEAMEHLMRKGTTTLQLDTAYGKTIISVYLATRLSKLTLVIHPGKTLHKQWIKAFKEATNAGDLVWDVYKKQPKEVCVIVSTTGMLSHIPKYLLDNVGTLIMDETHKLCTPSAVPSILTVMPQYIIGSSYTYEKTDGTHFFMDLMLGLHRVTGRLDLNLHAIRLNTPFMYEVPKNKQGTDYTALISMVVNNEERNKFICDLVAANIHRKIIVLTPRVDHAEKLSGMLNEMGIKSDYITGKKQKYENSNVLVGSIGKINTGFDEKNYCDTYDGIPANLLINASSNKEHNLIVQIAGRLKRSRDVDPYLIDVVDNCYIFNKHAKERKKIYEKEGYHIYEVDNQIPVIGN